MVQNYLKPTKNYSIGSAEAAEVHVLRDLVGTHVAVGTLLTVVIVLAAKVPVDIFYSVCLLTCKTVDVSFHCSPCAPSQVPRRDRQTLPQLYKLGLNLTDPFPVVRKLTWGGDAGYFPGKKKSNTKQPPL